MNAFEMNCLLTIASAPVVDRPLPIRVTPEGKTLARRVRAAERIIADLPILPADPGQDKPATQ